MRRLIPVAFAAVALVAACGEQASPDITSVSPDQRYTVSTTVLESPEHGPQLCLGGVAESLPPQCGGPDIAGWDWSTVEAEAVSGTTWGDYTVVGTFDGTTFTLTEPAQPPSPSRPDTSPSLGTPCGEPDGGWTVVDPSTATESAMNDAIAYANAQPDYAGVWLDQSINEDLATASDDEIEAIANDPTRLVLNVSFTGDIDRHAAALRDVWGGALCVTEASYSEAELSEIQQTIHEEYDGALSSGTYPQSGQVIVSFVVDDGSLQAEFDDRYGGGVVVVNSALTPVD